MPVMTRAASRTTPVKQAANKDNVRVVTQEELEKNNGQDHTMWTAIYGTVYDMTDFYYNNKHPGGDILRLASGRDGTYVYEASHAAMDEQKVKKYLDQLPVVGELKDYKPVDSSFFETVRERCLEHLNKKGVPSHYFEIISLGEAFLSLALYIYCTYLVSFHNSMAATIGLGFLTGRLGFIMHMGNHHGMASKSWFNHFMGGLMDIIGGNSVVWSFDHQLAHHEHPNEPGKDNDCEIGNPHFRLNPYIEKRWYHKLNHIAVIIGMSGGFFKWFVADFFAIFEGEVGSIRFSGSKVDKMKLLFWKSMWIFVHCVIPVYYFGWSSLWKMVLFMVIGAHYLENIFVVNHIQDELSTPHPDKHWAAKQIHCTTNWSSSSHFWNWFSGGLNHQIEHHLFPSMSHWVYPIISPIVKETCEEYEIPYNNYKTFPEAWWAMFTYLKDLGNSKPVLQFHA